MDRINAASLLLARGAPQRPALVGGRRSLSYGELRRTVARAGSHWRDHGVQPGELVMLRGDHGIDHAVAFLGAIWAGAVPVPLRPPSPSGEADAPAEVEFALGGAWPRPGQVNTDGATRWQPWWCEQGDFAPLPEEPCEPWAPACWTEPRAWGGGKARVLPHRFALTLSSSPGVLPLAPTRTMLAMLRALRRGTTVLLQPDARRA